MRLEELLAKVLGKLPSPVIPLPGRCGYEQRPKPLHLIWVKRRMPDNVSEDLHGARKVLRQAGRRDVKRVISGGCAKRSAQLVEGARDLLGGSKRRATRQHPRGEAGHAAQPVGLCAHAAEEERTDGDDRLRRVALDQESKAIVQRVPKDLGLSWL